MNTPTEPPDDLREAAIAIIQKRNRFIVVQSKRVFDGLIDPQTADQNNIHLNRKAAEEILRLCEAAALAALPKPKNIDEFPEMISTEWIEENPHLSTKLGNFNGHNKAVATAQANIHSVFGGTS